LGERMQFHGADALAARESASERERKRKKEQGRERERARAREKGQEKQRESARARKRGRARERESSARETETPRARERERERERQTARETERDRESTELVRVHVLVNSLVVLFADLHPHRAELQRRLFRIKSLLSSPIFVLVLAGIRRLVVQTKGIGKGDLMPL